MWKDELLGQCRRRQPTAHLPLSPTTSCALALLLRQGCMKSGQVLTDSKWKWYEPEHWRFGDALGPHGINYMRHATGRFAAGCWPARLGKPGVWCAL